ncbi:MAG TPA: hypothetical protein VGF67_28495 [Ktedonobacteraceae bacterium]
MAALAASGVRWTPLSGAVAGLGTLIGGPASQPYSGYHLTHPAEGGPFVAGVLMCICALVAICTGIGATVQNYRQTTRRAPRWLPLPFTALGGFLLSVVLLTLPAGASTWASAPLAAVAKGATLLLVDDGAFPHILRNGQWQGALAHPGREVGAPLVQDLAANARSVEIGPFSSAGVLHLSCTIHAGMNLTIVVARSGQP